MKPQRLLICSSVLSALLLTMPSAIGFAAQKVGNYDFSYLTTGEIRATPVQVFDDGKSTYFQFRPGEAVPAIFSNADDRIGLVVPAFEGPYIRVAGVAGRYTLQLGRAQAQVVYAGGGREGAPAISAVSPNGMSSAYRNGYPVDPNVKLVASLGPPPVAFNATALEANSYSTPIKGDRVAWRDAEIKNDEHKIWFPKGSYVLGPISNRQIAAIATAAKAATRVVIIGRDDDSYKEGLENARANAIKAALVKSGAPAEKLIVRTGVQGEFKGKEWSSDIRVETALATPISRPTETIQASSGGGRGLNSVGNVESLLQKGVINRDQAAALLKIAPEQPGAPVQPLQPRYVEVPAEGFNFRSSDRTVQSTLRRWASSTSYQVVWDAPSTSDAPITGDGSLAANNMREALDKVVNGLVRNGYDIQATVYSNRVIRFTGSNK